MSPFNTLAFTVVHIEKSSSKTTKSGHSAVRVTVSPSHIQSSPVMETIGTTYTVVAASPIQLPEDCCSENSVVSAGLTEILCAWESVITMAGVAVQVYAQFISTWTLVMDNLFSPLTILPPGNSLYI